MDVLFALANWHGLAKLRQHTDLSLVVLDSATVRLGAVLRYFQKNICTAYDTKELNRELNARTRKKAKKTSMKNPIPESNNASADVAVQEKPPKGSSKVTGKLRKTLNLNTYKDHSLGDYVESIRRYGTVDSYSTELVNRILLIFIPLQSD